MGETIRSEGRILGAAGKRDVNISGIITNSRGEVCAESKGTFTRMSSKVALRLQIMSKELIRDFFEPLMVFKSGVNARSGPSSDERLKV